MYVPRLTSSVYASASLHCNVFFGSIIHVLVLVAHSAPYSNSPTQTENCVGNVFLFANVCVVNN